jgi:hypothetical protein
MSLYRNKAFERHFFCYAASADKQTSLRIIHNQNSSKNLSREIMRRNPFRILFFQQTISQGLTREIMRKIFYLLLFLQKQFISRG